MTTTDTSSRTCKRGSSDGFFAPQRFTGMTWWGPQYDTLAVRPPPGLRLDGPPRGCPATAPPTTQFFSCQLHPLRPLGGHAQGLAPPPPTPPRRPPQPPRRAPSHASPPPSAPLTPPRHRAIPPCLARPSRRPWHTGTVRAAARRLVCACARAAAAAVTRTLAGGVSFIPGGRTSLRFAHCGGGGRCHPCRRCRCRYCRRRCRCCCFCRRRCRCRLRHRWLAVSPPRPPLLVSLPASPAPPPPRGCRHGHPTVWTGASGAAPRLALATGRAVGAPVPPPRTTMDGGGGGTGGGGVAGTREERVGKDAAARMREEFSAAASSLARLYKMSSESRASGSRSAYRNIAEWVRQRAALLPSGGGEGGRVARPIFVEGAVPRVVGGDGRRGCWYTLRSSSVPRVYACLWGSSV